MIMRWLVFIALMAVMLQGCAANRGQLRVNMEQMEILTLLGAPDFMERNASEYRCDYYPLNDIPYHPASANLVIDIFSIASSIDKGVNRIIVNYTVKEKRSEDVYGRVSGGKCSPDNFLPDPLPGKWGEIRGGMRRAEVMALVGDDDALFISEDKSYLKCFPDVDIPYSSTLPELVVYEMVVSFSDSGVVDNINLWYLTPEGREERRGA